MHSPPRISVVSCSYNQGRFLGRTIDSVLAQDYPNLEHLVVDGMSTDETPRVLARYGHLRVIREPDRGQADAINKGFRAATGDVLGFLNSDDTLEPGALLRVAGEIDPARNRHVVMGRCRFIDEEDRPTGLEHPSAFESHRRVLEVWKGHCLPQPAVFWTRAVWERCGPLDEAQHLVLDYDFFCRVSRHFAFHPVDQVLANYRLHAHSKTCSADGRRVLEESIRVSRRYWGGLGWAEQLRLAASYGRFRLARRHHALALLRRARDGWFDGDRCGATIRAAACAAFAPDVLVHVAVLPALAGWCPAGFELLGWLARTCRPRTDPTRLQVWRAWEALHADGWAGPVCRVPVQVGPGARRLVLDGYVEIGHHPRPLEIEVRVDDRPLGRCRVGRWREFRAVLPLGEVPPGEHDVEMVSNTFLVPDEFRGNEDFRPLSFKVRQLRLTE
jgi:glycosyltransferase involved in cell wall biosynthesis